jgi:hypothetical protein
MAPRKINVARPISIEVVGRPAQAAYDGPIA